MNNLKKLREEKNLLQKDISNIINATQQQYSDYETNKRKISDKTLIKLALYYNTSIDYLVGLTEEKKPYPRAKEKEES